MRTGTKMVLAGIGAGVVFGGAMALLIPNEADAKPQPTVSVQTAEPVADKPYTSFSLSDTSWGGGATALAATPQPEPETDAISELLGLEPATEEEEPAPTETEQQRLAREGRERWQNMPIMIQR